MIGDVIEAAWTALWKPSVILVSASSTVGSFLAFRALGVDEGFWTLPWPTMQIVAVVVVARFWLDLTVTASALRVMRRNFQRAPVYWVPAPTAFQVGVVSIGLTIPILAGAVFLVVPGVILALRWSQAALLILDEKADWFEAAGASAELTEGRRLNILGVWLVVGLALVVAGWLGSVFGEIAATPLGDGLIARLPGLGFSIVANAFGLVVPAAVYVELYRGD